MPLRVRYSGYTADTHGHRGLWGTKLPTLDPVHTTRLHKRTRKINKDCSFSPIREEILTKTDRQATFFPELPPPPPQHRCTDDYYYCYSIFCDTILFIPFFYCRWTPLYVYSDNKASDSVRIHEWPPLTNVLHPLGHDVDVLVFSGDRSKTGERCKMTHTLNFSSLTSCVEHSVLKVPTGFDPGN